MLARCSLVLALAWLGACYSPDLRDCALTCGGGVCPSGLSCEAGYCRVPGFSGACGGSGDARVTDGPGDSTVVDVPPDLMCTHTCYTRGSPTAAIGSTACNGASGNNCNVPSMPWLDTIDFCPCNASFPILYLHDAGLNVVDVVFVVEPFSGLSYRMKANDGSCGLGSNVCPQTAVADCGTNATVWVWPATAVAPGVINSFDIYLDQGQGCVSPYASFAIQQ